MCYRPNIRFLADQNTYYIEIHIINDFDAIFDGNGPAGATTKAIEYIHGASVLLSSISNFKMELVITNVENWDSFYLDPSQDLNDYLEKVKTYWQTNPNGYSIFSPISDALIFLTGKQTAGTVAGVSYVATLCSSWGIAIVRPVAGTFKSSFMLCDSSDWISIDIFPNYRYRVCSSCT